MSTPWISQIEIVMHMVACWRKEKKKPPQINDLDDGKV